MIVDTNSHGRFDLVVYMDGFLAVKGTYVGVALRSAGAGIGAGAGGAVAAGTGASAGLAAGESYETKRLTRVVGFDRTELAKEQPNFFIALETILGLVLRKRWYGHSRTIRTRDHDAVRRFDWKPALNNFDRVRELLDCTFPRLVTRE